MRAPHLHEVAYVPERAGNAWRGEVIDVNSQQRPPRTSTTYRNRGDAISAATSLWRAKQAALLQRPGHVPQQVMA